MTDMKIDSMKNASKSIDKLKMVV